MTTQQTLQTEEYKQTELGELPKSWSVARLGNYCKVFSGFAFKSPDFVKEGVFVIKIGNLQNGTVVIDNRTNYFPKEKIVGNVKKFLLKEGDILIAMTGATTGKVGVVPKEHENSLLNQRVGKFEIFSGELDNSFFRYFSITQEFQEKVIDNILKSAQGNVSPKQIENIIISLPAIPEQQKIAYILSTVQTSQEKTQNFINSLKELKKSAMKHLFTYGAVSFEDIDKVELKETEIGMMPKEWDVVELISFSEKDADIVGGPFGSNLKVSDYKKEGVPILRLQNIERNKFINKDIKFISKEKADELKYHSFKTGDIVLAKLGDPIGKTCVVPDYIENGIVVADVVRIRTRSEISDKLFIVYALNSIFVEDQFRMQKTGTTRPRVNVSDVRKIKIPKMPLPEQQNIASILSVIDEKIQAEEQKKEALKETFNSLLKNLMTAKIRVNSLEVGA